MSLNKEIGGNASPAIRLAVISMVVCGLFFPLVVTGFAQVLFPDQANGSIAHLSGGRNRAVGSYLIAQNFSKPFFFQPRNSSSSASGVDPDITYQDALYQASRISKATNITIDALDAIINQNVEGTLWSFGYPYVNVLRLNLALIQNYQATYQRLDPSLFRTLTNIGLFLGSPLTL